MARGLWGGAGWALAVSVNRDGLVRLVGAASGGPGASVGSGGGQNMRVVMVLVTRSIARFVVSSNAVGRVVAVGRSDDAGHCG